MTEAGQLRERVTFQRRTASKDGYGNSVAGWQDQFTTAAELRPRLGGEAVLQERLAGRQPYLLTVRHFSQTAMVTPEWRAVDARNTNRVFNIRSVSNPDMRRQFLEFLVEEGVVT